jgi:hypothetical protein
LRTQCCWNTGSDIDVEFPPDAAARDAEAVAPGDQGTRPPHTRVTAVEIAQGSPVYATARNSAAGAKCTVEQTAPQASLHVSARSHLMSWVARIQC